MKLLFDQNLSLRLSNIFETDFPGSKHVSSFELSRSQDEEIWEFAKANNFTIVTKDSDFNDLCLLKGFPPKVIWIRKGNCSTSEIIDIITANNTEIIQFIKDEATGILTLY